MERLSFRSVILKSDKRCERVYKPYGTTQLRGIVLCAFSQFDGELLKVYNHDLNVFCIAFNEEDIVDDQYLYIE